MEQTTRLDLYKLANGDYANHWETPTNANMQAIDDEFAGLATELVGSTTGAFTGLKGTEASLVDRLNNAMEDTGDIKYNSGDLDKSCHQMDGFETTEINDRLGNIDRREFVNARLRYLQRTIASGEYLHKLDAYDPTSALPALDQNRYVESFSQRYGSQLFCFGTDCTDPTAAAGNVLEINPMGWCSIGGRLFYHKNISYYTFLATGRFSVLLSEEPITGATVNIDNRLIRSHVATGNTGDTTIGGSLFASAGIGAVSSVIANNDWQPEVFQILRIEVTPGVFDEYMIKAVNAGSVEIYGEFPYNPGLVGRNWWILDYTIPCVNLIAYAHSAAAIKALMNIRYTYGNQYLYTHGISYDLAAARFYATRMHNVYAHLLNADPGVLFVDMTSEALASAAPGDAYYEVDIGGANNVSPFNIKKMSVMCMERYTSGGDTATFSYAIDPMQYDAGTHLVPILQPEIVRTLTHIVGDTIDTWFDEPGEKGVPGGAREQYTYLRVYTSDETGLLKWCNSSAVGFTRVWWGVLIEYA